MAQWLRDLRSHPLFLDYSTWTQNQIKKSAQERCVVELIEAGKGDYKYVNHRGMVAEEVHKIVVEDEKKEVTII